MKGRAVWRLFGTHRHGGVSQESVLAGPRVFLSYAHESDAHKADVHRLHDLLAAAGVTPVMDAFYASTVKDWPLWCREQIDLADWVLVIASAAYKLRADSPEQLPEDEGRGVYWEARYIRDIVYNNRERASKILPVLLPDESAIHFPNFFTPDPDAVLSIPELTVAGVAEFAEILLGRRPLSVPLRGTRLAGWVYAGAGAGRTAAETVREHIVLHGRGLRAQARGGDLFRGRLEARKAIADWLQAEQPPGRVLVVTGQPGAGKSAVVARVALDAEPAAVAEGRQLGLVFHARSATLFDFLHATAVTTRTSAAETVSGLLERVRHAASPPDGVWRIVVDALDEAATAARYQLVQALVELATLPSVRVVVATRALNPDPDSSGSQTLLARLGVSSATARNLVDLDTDRYFELSGLVESASALLRQDGAAEPGPPGAGWQAYRVDEALCARLAAAIAAQANRNHLVAALAADSLSKQSHVVDPSASEFDPASMPSSVGDALDKYFEALRSSLDELRVGTEQARIRGMLTALAYARGSGVTDEMWIAFARALGRPVSMDDLDALRLGTVADFLLQSSTMDGRRVSRLFHQALNDELLADRPQRADEAKILDCLLPIAPATWEQATEYARTFVAEHANAAGRLAELLEDPIYPTVAEPSRLLAVLPTNPSHGLAQTVATIRIAGARTRDLDPQRRAGLYSLTAAQLGFPELSRRYQRTGNPTVRWAHSRGTAHLTLSGHTAGVRPLAVGRLGFQDVIVSGSSDRTVRIWDMATGVPVGQPLAGHTAGVMSVAIGHEVIVSSDDSGAIIAWDPATGARLGQTMQHLYSVYTVAVGRVGERDVVASGGTDGTVRIWDLVTGAPIGQPFTGHTGSVWSVAVARVRMPPADRRRVDGPFWYEEISDLDQDVDVVVSGGSDGTVRLHNAANGALLLERLTGHPDPVKMVTTARIDERHVIFAGSDAVVLAWDAITGFDLGQPMPGGQAIGKLDGRDVIISCNQYETEVRVWDATTGTELGQPLTGHTDGVKGVAIGRAGDHDVIVTAGDDCTVRIWDFATAPAGHPLRGNTGEVNTVTSGRAGNREVIVTGSGDSTVHIWDAASGAIVSGPLGGRPGVGSAVKLGIESVAIGTVSGRDVIVSSGFGHVVNIRDAATGAPLQRLSAARHARAVAVGRIGDRDVIITGAIDGTVSIWDAVTGDPVVQPFRHAMVGRAYAIGRVSGRLVVATAGEGGDQPKESVQVWDLVTGTLLCPPMIGHTGGINALAVGQVDERDAIVSAGHDRTVRVWDPVAGTLLCPPMTGHTDAVNAVALGRVNGRDVVVSGGDDRTVRIWDATAGKLLAVIDTLDPVKCLACAGRHLAVGSGIAICEFTLA